MYKPDGLGALATFWAAAELSELWLFSKWTMEGVSSGIEICVMEVSRNFCFAWGGAGALFFFPNELMEVTDPEEMVDKLVPSRWLTITRSRFPWCKFDNETDLDGRCEWFVVGLKLKWLFYITGWK